MKLFEGVDVEHIVTVLIEEDDGVSVRVSVRRLDTEPVSVRSGVLLLLELSVASALALEVFNTDIEAAALRVACVADADDDGFLECDAAVVKEIDELDGDEDAHVDTEEEDESCALRDTVARADNVGVAYDVAVSDNVLTDKEDAAADVLVETDAKYDDEIDCGGVSEAVKIEL